MAFSTLPTIDAPSLVPHRSRNSFQTFVGNEPREPAHYYTNRAIKESKVAALSVANTNFREKRVNGFLNVTLADRKSVV